MLTLPKQWSPTPAKLEGVKEVTESIQAGPVEAQRKTIPFQVKRRQHGGKRSYVRPSGSIADRFGPGQLGLSYLLEKRGDSRGHS
jgi:hypothetical protein